jgi:hypothetical protein
MRTIVVQYSYFYDGNRKEGQNKAVSGGILTVNGFGGCRRFTRFRGFTKFGVHGVSAVQAEPNER